MPQNYPNIIRFINLKKSQFTIVKSVFKSMQKTSLVVSYIIFKKTNTKLKSEYHTGRYNQSL